jgi:hypothetical protein
VLSEVMNRDDVRMVERCRGPRLLLETRHAFRVSGEGRGQDLDRDVPMETAVASPVHLPHATGAKQRLDFVDAKAVTGGKAHRCSDYRSSSGSFRR